LHTDDRNYPIPDIAILERRSAVDTVGYVLAEEKGLGDEEMSL